MENIEKNQAVLELQKQIEASFEEWLVRFIAITSPPDNLIPIIHKFFHSAFSTGAQIGIRIAIDHYRGATKL